MTFHQIPALRGEVLRGPRPLQFRLESAWVMTALRQARKAERQSGQRKLFPVPLPGFDAIRLPPW